MVGNADHHCHYYSVLCSNKVPQRVRGSVSCMLISRMQPFAVLGRGAGMTQSVAVCGWGVTPLPHGSAITYQVGSSPAAVSLGPLGIPLHIFLEGHHSFLGNHHFPAYLPRLL